MNREDCFWPAEWHPQSAVQISWPDEQTDWVTHLDEVIECYKRIAREIAERQALIVVCRNSKETERQIAGVCGNSHHLKFVEAPINDTWARDYGPIMTLCGKKPVLLDFKFNGWGLKYPANYDNQITARIYAAGILNEAAEYRNHLNFVLEGGSIESDGQGTVLTTASCLLSPNRNGGHTKDEIESSLERYLHADRILWLENGYLAGDDTDGHIDTLARFCSPDSIAYVKCDDPADEHHDGLKEMERELMSFKTRKGEAYRLIPLPMADPVFDDRGNRLPATYANFLIINGAVLVPFYGSEKDELVSRILQPLFKERSIIGIDCRVLIKEHGSLHCMAMQYPEGVI